MFKTARSHSVLRPLMRPRTAQRGAASLLVVMVLFFAISLVAAYTSRNLIYEQRTSANQYRSTLAFETADAGLEWATAKLNEARMTDNCVPLPNAGAVSSGSPEPTFRERYVGIDLISGRIAPNASRLAGCVFNGSDWVCDCPASGEPNLGGVATTGTGPFPAFWVKFELANPAVGLAAQPQGVIAARVNACTRNDPACLRFTREAQSGDGVASNWVALALKSALITPPAAAVTARGAITAANFLANPGSIFTITNTDRATNGFTMISGSSISTSGSNLSVITVPGTPGSESIINPDPTASYPNISLPSGNPANVGADRMFASLFGTWPSTYAEQPAVIVLTCASACSSAQVNAALRWRPGRAVVLSGVGGLTLNADIGSVAEPVLLISEGPVTASPAGATFYGLLYVRAPNWDTAGTSVVEGAVVTEGSLFFAGNQTFTYNPGVLSHVQRSLGSFVRIPGGWRDFQP